MKSSNILELEKLFTEYYSALLLYAITIVKDKPDAEDIVQQAFIVLSQKLDDTSFHTSVKAYLYKSVYNASLDFLKHKKVKARYESETAKNSAGTLTETPGEEKELNKKLVGAINELPEQCGRIFKLSRLDGLRYREIADQLNISVKTVENQMGKALKLLRENLKDLLPFVLLLINF